MLFLETQIVPLFTIWPNKTGLLKSNLFIHIMEKLNRSLAPVFNQIENLEVTQAIPHTLKNGIPMFVLNTGTQDLLKLELLFRAGNWEESKRLVAATVNSMLGDGTRLHTAEEIADGLDAYGAFFQTENGADWASVTLYSLTKYLDKTLPLLNEILTESVFPEKELKTYLQNKRQNLKVNNERVDFIARKKFSEALFGAAHPYGYYATESDYDAIKREDLVTFFKEYYAADTCKIIVSGKVSPATVGLIDSFLGQEQFKNNTKQASKQFACKSSETKNIVVLKEESIQSAIRVGKLIVNKTHPDYMGLQVLNTVLGGYFGSRLMSNIREDKGYTYGIGSAVASNSEQGYFFISTETGTDVCRKALHEIYYEIKRLQEELVPDEELSLVKNYMLGTFLRSIDGPFELAHKFKGILTYDLGYSYYHDYINTVKNITSEKLRQLAITYLQKDSMIELVVGNE
jgi:zinc protease